MKGKLLSIMVLNWNRLHYSKQTIESVLEKVSVPHELILVDNNSAQSELKEYLLNVKGNQYTVDIKHVFNSKNLGTGGGRNSALKVASGDYLLNIDDDVILCDKFDHKLIEVCDKIPNIGQVGVNFEPFNYPVQVINGVSVCIKAGNLGEACTMINREVFNKLGYFNYANTYGHEGALYYFRLVQVGLLSAYIPEKGIHLDTDQDKAYREAKTRAHTGGSIQLKKFDECLRDIRAGKGIYVDWDENFSTVDEHIFTNDLILKDRK